MNNPNDLGRVGNADQALPPSAHEPCGLSPSGNDPSRNPEMTHEMRLKLDKRIHRQRVALRENWEIVERRHWYRKVHPVQSRYLAHFQRLHAEISELRRALQERVCADRGKFYRVVRIIPASAIEARRAETRTGSVHESATAESRDAQSSAQSPSQIPLSETQEP